MNRPAYALILALGASALAQTFEVASIKPSAPAPDFRGIQFPAGRFRATGATLRTLVTFAYEVRDFQVTGGPGWMATEAFDINATAGGGATPAQIRKMLQALLAERFALSVRRETREAPVYELTVARSGSKLQSSS